MALQADLAIQQLTAVAQMPQLRVKIKESTNFLLAANGGLATLEIELDKNPLLVDAVYGGDNVFNETGDRFLVCTKDTLLVSACRRGHVTVASMLLQRGAEVNSRCGSGWTALIYAAYCDRPEVCFLKNK